MTEKLTITPKTKVGELLDAFPQLENVLLELSPAFAKLKNPIVRKTVARVASLQQAAMVGGLKIDEFVNRLREEVGQDKLTNIIEINSYTSNKPDWFDETKITQSFDASPVINSGGSPMAEIISLAQNLNSGEILELKTPFVPAPVIDLLKNRGLQVFTLEKDKEILSFIYKS